MRLSVLAICIIVAAVVIGAVGLSHVTTTSASHPCFLATLPPSATPVPDNTIDVCNNEHATADELQFYVIGPMGVEPIVAQNVPGCDTPTTSASESAPDFTNLITVTWPTECVTPGATLRIAFDCYPPGGCDLHPDCVQWLVDGQVIGSACPTPNCGGVPCCNGLPCPTPTREPSCPSSPTPYSYCNDTGRNVDGLNAYLIGGQSVDVEAPFVPYGCTQPTVSNNEHHPDFTYWVTVQFSTACIQKGFWLYLNPVCTGIGTPEPCGPDAQQCVEWTLDDSPVGPPCEPPACGSAPCCPGNDWPCPTPTAPFADMDADSFADTTDNCPTVPNPYQLDRDNNGIGDLCDVPNGDVDCDFLVRLADVSAMLHAFAGVALDRSDRCKEIANGATRPLGDLNCDGSANGLDLVRLLRFESGLPNKLISGCPAIAG